MLGVSLGKECSPPVEMTIFFQSSALCVAPIILKVLLIDVTIVATSGDETDVLLAVDKNGIHYVFVNRYILHNSK